MNKIKKIPMNHICNLCGYLITGVEKKYARYDYSCPNCKKQKFSEFSPSEKLTDSISSINNNYN
jgi:rubrerythrin